jgi:transposase
MRWRCTGRGRGPPIAEIADDVGVNRETLRSWVRADDQRRGGSGRSTAATLAPGSVEAENAESRRRVEAQASRKLGQRT